MIARRCSLRTLRSLASVASLAALTTVLGACTESTIEPLPVAPRGVLVLDGFIQPGISLLADTGTARTKIDFAPSSEFDAGGFTLERDTVLAVSSRGAGDLLYLFDVASNTVRRFQMPARSNPGRARLLRGANGQALIGVALRDSGVVALVTPTGTNTATITRIANAGLCPTDVFQYDNATWVVDANASCRTNYTVQGDARLIRIPNTGTTRDTIVLPGARSSGVNAIVVGDVAYIAAGGAANFATTPFTLLAGGTVTKVDLRTRRVLTQRSMPAGTFGASTKLGRDGFLYVTTSENLVTFRSRTLKLRQDDLSFVTTGASPYLPLTGPTGDVACSAATADELGRLHCIQNGTGSATSLLVFDAGFREIRRVPAGQGGVDLALR